MGRSCELKFTDTWKKVVPKVLELSKHHSTLQLQKFVDMYFHDNISDGKPEDILGAATYWGEVVLFLEVL